MHVVFSLLFENRATMLVVKCWLWPMQSNIKKNSNFALLFDVASVLFLIQVKMIQYSLSRLLPYFLIIRKFIKRSFCSALILVVENFIIVDRESLKTIQQIA